MNDELEFIVEEISRKSGKSKEEIWNMVRKYVAEYDGILREDGAVYLVAHDLGVKLEQKAEKIKGPEIIPLEKVVPGMRRAMIRGRIIRMIGVVPYISRDGEKTERAEFFISDGKKTARAVVWSKGIVDRIKKGEIQEGDVVMISRARIGRRGEEISINIDSESEINVLEGEFPEYPTPSARILSVAEILSEEFPLPEVDVRGILSNIFQPAEFSKKDGETGRRVTLTLRDEKTGDEIRVVFWNEKVDLLSGVQINSPVVLKNMRIRERNGSIELHSTALTEVFVEGPQTSGFFKGEIIYLSKIRDIALRNGSKKMLYFIIKKNGELLPGRAWDDAAEMLSRTRVPCLVEIKDAYTVKLGDRDFLSIDKGSKIRIIESRTESGAFMDYSTAKGIIYTKTSISEAIGGLVEVRGLVSYVGDIFIRWYCEKCGERVEREYGKFVCPNCGDTTGLPRPSLTIFIDDGTGVAKAVITGKDVEQVVKKSVEEMLEEIDMKGLELDRYSPDDLRNKLNGEEVIVRGSARIGNDGVPRIIVEEMEAPRVEYEISFLTNRVRNMITELSKGGDRFDQSDSGEQGA